MENTPLVLFTICGFSILLTAVILVIVWLAARGLANLSGWPRLAQRYPATYPPASPPRLLWAIRVGPVRFRWCVRFAAEPQGLYLAMASRLHHNAPLRIPWHEIKGVSDTFLYLRQAKTLSIGDPLVGTATVYRGVYEEMQRYLQV